MGATAVQAKVEPKYERTTDPKRMLTHQLLNEAIRTDWENIKGFLPARTATLLSYKTGATKAKAHNKGEAEISIDLPLKDGWYVPDGNPFAIPNGKASNSDNPDALYLVRHRDRSFNGSVARVAGCRYVDAFFPSSGASGVALVGSAFSVSSLGTPDITNPTTLVQRAERLETAAKELTERLGQLDAAEYARLIKPILDEAAFLRGLAGKFEAIRPKA